MTPTTLHSLLTARYGASAPPLTGEAETVLTQLLSHKSVRRYSDAPLPPNTLETVIAAAQSTATSSNLQAWSVVALENPAHKAQAAALCGAQKFIEQAPLFLVFCADLARLTAVSAGADLPGEGLEYLEMFLIAVIDAALAAQNTAIAAESLGLGICYVGAARNKPRELAELLRLPPRVFALFGMTIGVPADEDRSTVKPRLTQAAVLHRETYDADAQQPAVIDYNHVMRQFYTEQNMTVPDDWAHHSARRVASVASLTGRHLLREILEERGFSLK